MKSSAIVFAKSILRPVRAAVKNKFIKYKLQNRIKNNWCKSIESFEFDAFKKRVLKYLKSVRVFNEPYLYKYSKSCTKPTLYASAYACMTISLLGETCKLEENVKNKWRYYFDGFQSENDGLFYDPVVEGVVYNDSDWWGSRHLALHMISAYSGLGFRPKNKFLFLSEYYGESAIQKWLDNFDWTSPEIGLSDLDNKIMNIGCLLQYQRDTWGDAHASFALETLKKYLKSKIDQKTGMWGCFDKEDPNQRSRMVQFAYHLFPLFFYDEDYDFDVENISKVVLKTQNEYGGYGVNLNSSACEDIDSIDILIKFYKHCSVNNKIKIDVSLRKAFNWVLLNQVKDGGFVFRLYEPFFYGNIETSSESNMSAMLPTWFRLLSVAYMSRHLGIKQDFKLTRCPGYEFI
jgi:hypothetical protein